MRRLLHRHRYAAGAAAACALVVSMLPVRGTASPSATGYSIVDLGAFSGDSSQGRALNEKGQVVGYASVSDGINQYGDTNRPVLWNGGPPPINLGIFGFGFPTSDAYDINESGVVVGTAYGTNTWKAFVWTPSGGLQELPRQSPYTSDAAAITNAGEVIGRINHRLAKWTPLTGGGYEFLVLDTSAFYHLGMGVNATGHVVANRRPTTFEATAVLWTGTTFVVLPTRGGTYTAAQDINDSGVIVGTSNSQTSTSRHATYWEPSEPYTLHDVHPAGLISSSIAAINNMGDMVGTISKLVGLETVNRAYMWSDGSAIDLNSLLPANSGWTLLNALDINDRGQITGYGLIGGKYHAYLMSPNNTVAGLNVTAEPIDAATGTTPVDITFSNVLSAGNTTLMMTATGLAPPDGFTLGSPPTYYNIATTATFSGFVEVCINYTGVDFGGATPELKHHNGTSWEEITTSHTPPVICGSTPSLSPFAIMVPARPSNTAPTVYVGGPSTVSEGGSVTLTATGTDQEDEETALTYAWDLDNDGNFETSGQQATFSAVGIDGPAALTVRVQVTDSGGLTALSIATIDVLNAPPAVGAITLTPNPVLIGAQTQATASFSDPAIADIPTATWTWTWGDGTSTAGGSAPGVASAATTYTAVGAYPVALTITDDDGGAATKTAVATVIYRICPLYHTDRAVRSGSTVPIKVQICNAAGANLSSPAIALHAAGIALSNATATGMLEDSGYSSADLDFRYDATLAEGGAYIFNLSTAGLGTGTYALRFTADGEDYEYTVPFQVR